MSLILNGTSQAGTAAIVVPASVFSIVGWIKPHFSQGDALSSVIADTDPARSQFVLDSTLNAYTAYIDARSDVWSTTWTIDTWYQVAIVCSKAGDRIDIYQGGVKKTPTLRAGVWGSTAAGTQITIGARYSQDSSWFLGRLAQFAVYTIALADADIAALVTKNPDQVQAASCQNYWPLDTSGAAVIGSTAMTFVGSPTFSSTDNPVAATPIGPGPASNDKNTVVVGRSYPQGITVI